MNPAGAGGFDRCAKHPSQLFTGFCSSCLAERLYSVDPVERNPNPSSEIVEIRTDSPDKDRNHGEARVRKTLLSLFQLDDGNGAESSADARSDLAKSASVGSSSRSSSSAAAKGLKWRSVSRRAQVEEGCFNCVIGGGGGGGRHLERKHSLRRSDRDDSKDGLEKPRHSWDGSMMGKALTCSFAACLEEPHHDGSSRMIRRSMPEGTIGSAEPALTKSPREVHRREESRGEINVSDVCRKKSQRWSRVWDWTITSPFRDLGKKRQHVLDRSMSESWPESRGMAEPRNAAHSAANGSVSVRTTTLQGSKRSTNGAGNELQKYRPDMQRRREYRFSRSRSVHYTSPRNVDNGLLRFYLTPMRTSRSTNKGRTKTSRFFTKSLLGL